jgi:nucleotide-binding universal stress UspA family protein
LPVRAKDSDQGEATYTHILIPTDGSELAGKAVRHGIALAKRIGAKVTMLTVLPPEMITDDAHMIEIRKARMQKHAKDILGAVAMQAAGVPCETIQVEHQNPYQAIFDTADSKGCDLIVMASHGRRGIAAIVLGSETVKVLTHCKIPVLVYRRRIMATVCPFGKISRAYERGVLASLGARLTIVRWAAITRTSRRPRIRG